MEEETEGVGQVPSLVRSSTDSDHYRMLFSKVDTLCRKGKKKAIAMTSSIKGEGKTTTVANLAVAAARDFGKRSLLVDGDFNNPELSVQFGMTEGPGLIDVIGEQSRLGKTIRRSPIGNLAILPMGQCSDTKKGSNVWTSAGIKDVLREVRGWFDYIWIDAPPVLPLFDMNVISESVDGILLVVQAGETPTPLLSQAVKSLDSKKIIGSVLNRAKIPWPPKYYKYGY